MSYPYHKTNNADRLLGRRCYRVGEDLPPGSSIEARLELIICGTNLAYGAKAWAEDRDATLRAWIAKRPGTRPDAWWLHESPLAEPPIRYEGREYVRDSKAGRLMGQTEWLTLNGHLTASEKRRLPKIATAVVKPVLRAVPSIRPPMEDES